MTWRCSDCGHNWPYLRQYMKCPACGEKCSTMSDFSMNQETAQALADEYRRDREAAQAKAERRREFDEWYAERELAKFREELDSQAW